MDFVKKIPPAWFAVAILFVIVLVMLFRQRRSGYTPATGAPISMMDLQEYSFFLPEQKEMYLKKMNEYEDRLKNAATTNDFTTYRMTLNEIMTNAFVPLTPPPQPPMPPTPPPQRPMPTPPPPPPAM